MRWSRSEEDIEGLGVHVYRGEDSYKSWWFRLKHANMRMETGKE
jgi:hypothetical protein